MLVGTDALSSSAYERISMMAAFDPAESQRLRQVLAAHHGDDQDLLMSVGIILGSEAKTSLTDANKEATVCSKVKPQLVDWLSVSLPDFITVHFAPVSRHDEIGTSSLPDLAALSYNAM